MIGFDDSVVSDFHVQWDRLTADAQADLVANYPRVPDMTTDPDRFQAWLDSSYLARHSNDSILDDPNFT